MTVQNPRTLDRMTEEAVYQAKRAATVAGEIKPLADEVNRVETRLGDLRAEADRFEAHLTGLKQTLDAKKEEMEDASTQAQDLREMVEEKCAANGWPVPEPPGELNLRNTDTFPAVGGPPRSAQQIIGKAVDELSEPPHGVSLKCFKGLCKTDPEACEGCEHHCHWLDDAPTEKPQEAEQTQPDPAPEQSGARAVRTPWALLLALYVRMQLAERGEGRHAGRWRIFKHRALIEVV